VQDQPTSCMQEVRRYFTKGDQKGGMVTCCQKRTKEELERLEIMVAFSVCLLVIPPPASYGLTSYHLLLLEAGDRNVGTTCTLSIEQWET